MSVDGTHVGCAPLTGEDHDQFKLLGAALIVAAIVAPASAQQAISEPGAYSFYHPNNDVLNGGRANPRERHDRAVRERQRHGARCRWR